MKIRSTHEVCVGRVVRVFIHFILMPQSSSTRDYSLWICIFAKIRCETHESDEQNRKEEEDEEKKFTQNTYEQKEVHYGIWAVEAHTTLPKRNGMTKMRKFRRKLNRVENK